MLNLHLHLSFPTFIAQTSGTSTFHLPHPAVCLSTAGYVQDDWKEQSLGLSQNDPQWQTLQEHRLFYSVGPHSLGGLARSSDREKDMVIKPQDRPRAILPGSKLSVNQAACLSGRDLRQIKSHRISET